MITFVAAVLATAPSAVELTVYNQGFGLVKETRNISLTKGRQTIAVEDVASMIEPSSVSVQSLTEKGSLRVLEQNYQYDLISPLAILEKSVGGKIRFIRTVGNTREVLEGTLISSPTAIVNRPEGGMEQTYNGMVIRTDDGRIVLNPTGEVEVTNVPKGLISKPTLLWDLESSRAGENQLELSYITRGLSWSSDYVLTLDGATKAGLQAWVTLDNQSGASYENAKLKLLAGDVQRAADRAAGFGGLATPMNAAKMVSDANFREESLFEYHLYTLQRPTTVRQKETKQVSLLEAPSVSVEKRLVIDATRQFGTYLPNEGEIGLGRINPAVRIEFENKTENGLGVPMPQGKFKVYQRDASGSTQFLGEDQIAHTPKNERLSITVGRSFDVVAERRRTNFHRVSDRVVQESFEIEIRNRKETAERVYVIERSWGDWKLLQQGAPSTKLDANTFQFALDLKANEVRKLSYTIETRW